MASDIEALLSAAEEETAEEVDRLLAEMHEEILSELDDADEIVAARFRLSSIASMWKAKVPRLMRRLFRVAGQAADTAATDGGGELPEGWDDLPGRFDDGTLPSGLDGYATATQALLDAVGDHMAEAAIRSLNEGIAAGEDTAQLRDRLAALFSADGTELGPYRSELISVTEATRAWNAATVAAAQVLTGLARPLVKQWRTQADNRVRDAHADTEGQLRLLDDAFDVAGTSMAYPGDPSAPANLVVNCRCYVQLSPAQQDLIAADAGGDGTVVHTGAMLALVPSHQDAERLAIEGGDPASELHVTLALLAEDASTWDEQTRAAVIRNVEVYAHGAAPIEARLFGINHWNPGEGAAWVWPVGDAEMGSDRLHAVRSALLSGLEEVVHPSLPVQYSPVAFHMTAGYRPDDGLAAAMAERLGPVTFDRIRLAFGGDVTDIPFNGETGSMNDKTEVSAADAWPVRTWTTPGDAALAFENEQTGDGRVFAPGSLYWEGGPWPLQYCDSMGAGHDGAELAGAIQSIERDGDRIAGEGVLYPVTDAGWEAAMLLDQGAPLGVSVDLDDVDLEVVQSGDQEGEPTEALDPEGEFTRRARIGRLSVLRLPDGAWSLTASASAVTASGSGMVDTHGHVTVVTGTDGRLTASMVSELTFGELEIQAAAGDPDPEGTVVMVEKSGDMAARITRARVRGATLVPIPAYDRARIVIDPEEPIQYEDGQGIVQEDMGLAASADDVYAIVVAFVRSSTQPLTVRTIAQTLGLKPKDVRRHLRRAVEENAIVKLSRTLYAAATEELSAAASGDTSLPVAPRDTEWDGDAAAESVLGWASDDEGNVDPDRAGDAFFWYDSEAPELRGSYKLGFARLQDGSLEMVPNGVIAAAAAVQGARGGVDIPEADMDGVKSKIAAAYGHLNEALELDPPLIAPWEAEDDMSASAFSEDDELTASVWTAMRDVDPMPAAWFKEPTAEELPPGSGGVHHKDGRVFGWVAQKGVPHASYGSKVTIEKLAAEGLDTTHFLRARFPLDDGTTVKAGAFTMNVGHHRDGFECETAACTFDDSRTVGGIVTVGLNEGGMWFSGAASPWMSTWDLNVFKACQPSYHMVKGADGRWQMRGLLSVPVPGHSSPLTAAAVIDRTNLALTAAATAVLDRDAERDESAVQERDESPTSVTSVTDAVTAALADPAFLDGLAAAMERRAEERDMLARELAALDADLGVTLDTKDTKEGA